MGKWKSEEAIENLRANQVDQKHRELDNEEVLKNLYELMVKVIYEHRKIIQQMNMDRWTSGVLTLQRHLVPKFQETKQAWFDARTVFKGMMDDETEVEDTEPEKAVAKEQKVKEETTDPEPEVEN